MTYTYADEIAVAKELLAEYGASAVFSRTTGETFDPVTGTTTGGTSNNFTLSAARFTYRQNEIDGQSVQRGDFRLICATGDGAPAIGDKVAFDGTDYRAIDVQPFSASGVDVYYWVQCRV